MSKFNAVLVRVELENGDSFERTIALPDSDGKKYEAFISGINKRGSQAWRITTTGLRTSETTDAKYDEESPALPPKNLVARKERNRS